MKTLEIELQAENGIVRIPDDLQTYHNAKVRITFFVDKTVVAKEEINAKKEEPSSIEQPKVEPIVEQAIPQMPPQKSNNELYSKYIETANLDVALEGLLNIAMAISKINKAQEGLQDKAQIEAKLKEISELEYIKMQIQEVVSRLKMQQEVDKTVSRKMADSSETINTIERMKNKIAENEILSTIYEKFKNSKEIDPEIEKKINEVLDLTEQKKKAALDELKKKMGIV